MVFCYSSRSWLRRSAALQENTQHCLFLRQLIGHLPLLHLFSLFCQYLKRIRTNLYTTNVKCFHQPPICFLCSSHFLLFITLSLNMVSYTQHFIIVIMLMLTISHSFNKFAGMYFTSKIRLDLGGQKIKNYSCSISVIIRNYVADLWNCLFVSIKNPELVPSLLYAQWVPGI